MKDLGWIEWHGVFCPVALNQQVETITRDGAREIQLAATCGWRSRGWRDDVMKYRVVQS